MISLDACLKNASSVAIAGHVRPDGDSVGSCLAVYNYICDNYPRIQTDIYLEPIPKKFTFLKNADRVRHPKTSGSVSGCDLFIALDCGDAERLGDAISLFKSAEKTLCVDHHVTNRNFADVNEIHPEASSASELVWSMLDQERVTEAIAECLYLGIVHDTGVFQYSCTSPETMRIAGALMERGIPYSRIVDETYYVRTFTQQKIWGRAMCESTLCLDGKCIFAILTKKEMDACGAAPKDLDGITSQLRSTKDVEVAALMYETQDGYKLSLRSTSYVDVAKIAVEFGGGGHARASGAFVSGEAETFRDSLLESIQKQL